MRGISLLNADLRGAILIKADLRYAKLSGAKLQDAKLQGALLNDAELENTILENAEYDRTTVWPRRFNPRGAGAIDVSYNCSLRGLLRSLDRLSGGRLKNLLTIWKIYGSRKFRRFFE